MKYGREKLSSTYSADNFVFFWGHTPAKSGEITQSCLSQWWKCNFTESGINFCCAEQYMMYRKALLFKDHEHADEILKTKDPKRIKALGRRSENYSDSLQQVGNLILDGNRYEMRSGDKSVKLTNKEYQLLELFVLHPGFVFSTEHLMDRIWGFESDSDIDVVWTHIGFVRKKLRSIGANVEIKTIRGSGYSLEVEKC